MFLFRATLAFLAFFSTFHISTTVSSKNNKKKNVALSQYVLNKPYFERKEGGVVLPKGFKKGVAYSTYQNGGHRYWKSLGYKPKSNWTWFEEEFKTPWLLNRRTGKIFRNPFKSISPIDFGQTVGDAAKGWDNLFEDIKLMKKLKINSLRFELPWTDLNPEKGKWNEEAFALFDKYINKLIANGIEPMITLYHWVHPLWFHEQGGWEKKKNIAHYISFVKKAVSRFGDRVKCWNTINEPTIISACGYGLGTHAPGKKSVYLPGYKDGSTSSKKMRAKVLYNLLCAHNKAYEAIKKDKNGGDSAQVGIVHQLAQFKGSSRNPVLQGMRSLFAHDPVMKFLQEGEFEYDLGNEKFTRSLGRVPKTLDFVGLNFYASTSLGWFGLTKDKGEKYTDMENWTIRPHDLYKAIKEMSKLGVPIMITENGIPDAKDDRRAEWIIGYSNAVDRALKEGFNVTAFYYWSFVDNFEWNMGHDKMFGLCTRDRQIKDGAEPYINYFKLPEDPVNQRPSTA